MKQFGIKQLSVVGVLLMTGTAFANYSVSIINPSQEQTYQRPAQTVQIEVVVTPTLAATDNMILKIDGKEVSRQLTYDFASIEYDPGMHSITAEVQNDKGQVLASDSRTIYLIQNTRLMREKRAHAKAVAEYNALPWYKKLHLNLRQDVEIPKETNSP
ncbi:MAG: hypothetical protein Q4C68_01005 [Moraxella sp.]|nr:hypothetical protein [Moraxella sp.]